MFFSCSLLPQINSELFMFMDISLIYKLKSFAFF